MAIRPELRAELMKLPQDERIELADELYESIELVPEWERAWSKEIGSRVQDIAHGKVELLDGETIFAELDEELRTRQ